MTNYNDIEALRLSLETYRKAADQLRRRINEQARARAELDSAQDALHDARAASELAHSDKSRGRASQLVAADVYEQEARARVARDVLRLAERDLEQARATERAAREELASWRVLALVISTLGGML